MAVTDDAKAIMQALSGKTLTNPQMLSIAQRFADSRGYSNPWDETENPTEYAAWPTAKELASFFRNKLRNEIRADIGRAAGKNYDSSNKPTRDAEIVSAQDEL